MCKRKKEKRTNINKPKIQIIETDLEINTFKLHILHVVVHQIK